MFIADVETIEVYPEFNTILTLLKKSKEIKLYQMFMDSKNVRMKHEH